VTVDLRKRLARLDQLTRRPATGDDAEAARRPAAVRSGAGADADLARVMIDDLGLTRTPTPSGDLWWRDDRRPVPAPAGGDDARAVDVAGILPAGTPGDLRWSDILFIDTETTGLAGGTGTLPFLVGLAWYDRDGLTVRQLFLPGPGQEEPLLGALADLAARFRVAATYNGAAFDLPLLRTRARLARRDDPCGHLTGWDLLVAVRRLWGWQLPDCRQQTMEAMLRGEARGPGDIDGALIPAVYTAFVRDGDAGLLPAVLRHNRRDMEGMARVLAAMADRAEAVAAGPNVANVCWQEAWRNALVAERSGDRRLAAAWAADAADTLHRRGSEDIAPAAILDAIRLLKREADWPRVRSLAVLGLDRWPDDPRLHYEAAVLYEHRLGEFGRALVHARALGDPRRIRRLEDRLPEA
jgi:uncharacterized protein YprB with RNaseH-like and TPR domain